MLSICMFNSYFHQEKSKKNQLKPLNTNWINIKKPKLKIGELPIEETIVWL